MRQFRAPLYPFSVAALATLAACAGYEPVTPSPAAVVTSPPVAVQAAPATTVVTPGTTVPPGTTVVVPEVATVRPGDGRVESSTRMSEASGLPNPLKRYGVRMDDGTVQFFDSRAPNLSIGDRVELTADNHIRYPM